MGKPGWQNPLRLSKKLSHQSPEEETSANTKPSEIPEPITLGITTPPYVLPDAEVPAKATRKRKDAVYWEQAVGKRRSDHKKHPVIQAVGTDLDHPTDEQARNLPHATEEASAVGKIWGSHQNPEGAKVVDTKWVYVIKRKPDGTISKCEAREVGMKNQESTTMLMKSMRK